MSKRTDRADQDPATEDAAGAENFVDWEELGDPFCLLGPGAIRPRGGKARVFKEGPLWEDL